MLFVKPECEESWCMSCHNYSRGTCKGKLKKDIVASLSSDDDKQKQWDSEIVDYESALEQSEKGRVTKMQDRFRPPVIVSVTKDSSHSAKMVLPHFWPEDVYKRVKGQDIAEADKATYEFKGSVYAGIFLDPVAHPPAVGVIILSEEEKTGVQKTQEVGNSSEMFAKGATKRLWSDLQQQSGVVAETKVGEDGSVAYGIKSNKRSLARNISESSSNECDWKDTISMVGASSTSSAAGAAAAVAARASAGKAGRAKKAKTGAPSVARVAAAKVSPVKSKVAATPRGGGAAVVYKSVQLREINGANQLVAKIEPLVGSLANDEGLKALTVEKVASASSLLEKRCAAASVAKLTAKRGDELDDVAKQGQALATKLHELTSKYSAVEFLARALTAKSAEAGMFWHPSAIREGISRCADAGVDIAGWAFEQCVHRELISLWRPEKICDLPNILKSQKVEGMFTLEVVPEACRKLAQESLVLYIVKRLFEKGVSNQLAIDFFRACGNCDWVYAKELQQEMQHVRRLVCHRDEISNEVVGLGIAQALVGIEGVW